MLHTLALSASSGNRGRYSPALRYASDGDSDTTEPTALYVEISDGGGGYFWARNMVDLIFTGQNSTVKICLFQFQFNIFY